MRWPFVSRREHPMYEMRYDEYRVALTREAAATFALDASEHRFADLLAKYHALKLQGALVVEPTPAPIIVPPSPVDPVREKIREQVRANPSLAGLGGYLSDYARELRDMRNLSPAQIVEALGKWESSEDQSAAVDSYVETAPTTAEEIAEVIA